jgi:hypothetical protein
MVKRCQSFPSPIRSWVDLPHVCDTSNYLAFHFRGCQNCFRLLLTLSTLGSLISLIPGTFHPKRWSLSSPRCPASKHLCLNSDPLNLALTGKPAVRLHQNVLSSPLSIFLLFKGVIEYLEDLVTFIDVPQLNILHITLFNQIDFDTPRPAQFINRTPKFRKREAQVEFDDSTARITLRYRTPEMIIGDLLINISCREPDWQLSSVAQVCNSSLPPLSTVEDLYIEHDYLELIWNNGVIENNLWLELLLPFTALKNLYLSKKFAPGIAAALQELVGGRITEVLPCLQNIFVEGLEPSGPLQENIGQFVTARQFSDHPIAISDWDMKSM